MAQVTSDGRRDSYARLLLRLCREHNLSRELFSATDRDNLTIRDRDGFVVWEGRRESSARSLNLLFRDAYTTLDYKYNSKR